MSIAQLPSHITHVTTSIQSAYQQVEEVATTPMGQRVIGFALGVISHLAYVPLTERVLVGMGYTVGRGGPSDPLSGMPVPIKIALMPLLAVLGPIAEEVFFREKLPAMIQENLQPLFSTLEISNEQARLASRVTAVFFSSIFFGLIHFSNALFFCCDPMLFLPQVIASTILGFGFGLARECTGSLDMPIGMHVGNNTFACLSEIL
ncbi:MAG: hypothetical protein SP1CHLAM54_10060 [Chlamydiia bacterium]|nr:hypothetical protein [Chlamydiia bacterium]MCH9615912.1 hypothetical protein [Chlamydiia bacterium]MCH9628685.1 hypothetical protein [Chlamydiia bacterium]